MNNLDLEVEIKFPCQYPIKIMGRNVDRFEDIIMPILERSSPGLCKDSVKRKLSREGNFISITVVLIATGKPQLEQLHLDLKATGLVSLVL